jgi:hypothetical protein
MRQRCRSRPYHYAKKFPSPHSITSSARLSSVGGTVRPSMRVSVLGQ